MLHAEEDSTHVDIHDAVEDIARSLRKCSGLQRNPRIVEREVEPPVLLQRPRNRFRAVFLTANVAAHENAFAARLLDQRYRLRAFRFAPARDHHPCALFSKCDGRGAADARGAASD